MKHETISVDDYRITSPSWMVSVPFFIIGYLFSLWYIDAYYLGDMLHYTSFYNSLYRMPSEHWAGFQRDILGSSEPLYRYVLAAGAYYGFDRTLYLSMWNGVLVAAVGYILVKYRCSLIFGFLVLTNYYLFVLLGSAERLKFAYVFLFLAFAVEGRAAKFTLAAVSPFLHTQAMVQFASGFGFYIVANLRNFAKTPLKSLFLLLVLAVVIAGVSYLFISSVGQAVETKSAHYSAESGGLMEAVQWAMLLAAGVFLFKERLAYFVGMMPMGVLTVLFGNRVNVATLALFAGLAILQRKTSNPVVLAVMAYMTAKSVPFLIDVAKFGTGYQ